MRVVLLAFHYPPNPEVGALRAAKVAATLAKAGNSVTVVHASSGETSDRATDHRDLLRLIPVVPAPSLRDWYRSLRAAAKPDRSNGKGAATEAWQPPASVSWLKRVAYSLMWLPDDQHGFIRRAAAAAIEALRRQGPGAVLYSTSPPASAQVAALITSLATGARWLMELRDPWTDNPGKPWYCRTAFTDGIERWLERRCLARATRVVAVSEGIARLASAKLGRDAAKVLVVRNGIDSLETSPPPRPTGPVRIVHAGTCYLGRDPRPFLRTLAAVARRRGLGPTDVQVELIGSCEWFDGVSVRGAARDLGIEELVTFAGWVPHAEAQQRIANADLLLLLAEGQPDQVPNKLYDYLGSRRRMLVFADPGGEAARMARAAGGHVVTHAADPELERQVEAALDAPRPGPVGDERLLREWSAERQMSRLVAAISELEPPA